MSGFDPQRLARLGQAMRHHVEADGVGGVAWLVAAGDQVEVGVAGRLTRAEPTPVGCDSIFRISSMTKPIVAVAALTLVEDYTLRLDDPVDALLPELSDRRVLVDGRGPLDSATVAAQRPITLRDVLTFRLGIGMDFAAPWPQPFLEALAELEPGAGPPEPQVPPPPDEWMRRLSTLPLLSQPGERWLYNSGSDVLGVLIARAAGRPLDVAVRERVLEPLGMVDTAFSVADVDRFGTCYGTDAAGARFVFDPPDGQWAKPPAFPSGAAGLVSTVDDLHAFARMLLSGGRLPDGSRLLSRAAVDAMTTDQIDVGSGAAGPLPDGSQGWGFGVGVQIRGSGLGPTVGSYGWAGGMGSVWSNDPSNALIGVMLSTDAFAGPFPPPPVVQDFWTGAYTALDN
ncbi:beta-lactamase family protein [Acidiferrimicrobium sp. IK]|uniref:serine hydrolase domain-containing protein n=1 Tax=Acidiferrimicrobium sp. IK TaxID=2871700 RepID=UPI0021CB573D|nr:serine hydrolase domain-containing protein [Acidiferrimicrobium sp. IK]MCU4186779.1 beta-lactamase family protein [Acidiferrimicrobium sp. IK]